MPSPQAILEKYWGYPQFRPLQEEIIQSVLAGKDTLALLPTGGGKSICFQVPGLLLDGLCLVISPLIALMKDQVGQLQKRGIAAQAIYSGLKYSLIDQYLDEAQNQQLKFLYISPERLKTELFLARAPQMNITLLAVDEAHCISQWGYDFRPAYLEIAQFKASIPEAALIALTASATPLVQEDIRQKLAFGPNQRTLQKSFTRENLSYSSILEENKKRRVLSIFQKIPGSSIIYVRSRRKCEEMAQYLKTQGISAEYYHAGLNPYQRSQNQEAWINGKIRVMVATNAFGMGIDKAEVRSVIHLGFPDTLEAYYQEAGRAGRDGKKSFAIVLYENNDIQQARKWVELSYPEMPFLRRVYQALANYFNLAVNAGEMQYFDFDLADFQNQFNLNKLSTYFALKTLEKEGFIQFNEAFYSPSSVLFSLDFKALYEFQLKNPGAEAIITLLSRLRGGDMQSNFFRISESTLGHYLKISTKQVTKQLERLQEMGVLMYDKQNESAQILFLQARYDAKHLPLNEKAIQKRKDRDLEKVEALIHYISEKKRCRNQLILEYFGEITEANCGICDNCVRRKKSSSNPSHEEEERLMQALAPGPLALKLVIDRVQPQKEKEFLSLIRDLLEEGKLQKLADGRIAKKM